MFLIKLFLEQQGFNKGLLMQLFSIGDKEAGLIEHQNANLINQLIN
ncbi:hypothetical protein ACIGC1_22150 [Peribacillus butanolivorans]